MDNSQANEDIGGLKHIIDGEKCDSIAIKDLDAKLGSKDQDSDTEQHKQPGVVGTLGGIVPAVAGLGPCFLDGFNWSKQSRSHHFLEVDEPTPAASVMSGLTLANQMCGVISFEHAVSFCETTRSDSKTECFYAIRQYL